MAGKLYREDFTRDDEFMYDELPETLQRAKPEEPGAADCCGGGCSFCVFDIHEQEMKIWRKECLTYLNKLQEIENEQVPVISPDKYTKFQISDIIPQTENCSLYRFTVPRNKTICSDLGQHLILRGKVGNKTITRQYTPVNPISAKGYFDVLIKLYDDGVMSQYVSTWCSGMEIEWRGPFGTFEYQPNSIKKLYMIAGGTGMAPMLPIIFFIIHNEDDETFIHLMLACKTYADILMRSTLTELKRSWNFTVSYYLSQEEDFSKAGYGEEVHYTHIDKELLANKIIFDSNVKVLVCGSTQFNNCMKACLCDMGFNDEQYFIF